VTLNRKGVEAGHVPPLTSDEHVHLTVFSPGTGGLREEAANFLVKSEHPISENVSGCYQEWNIPFIDLCRPEGHYASVEEEAAAPIPPGSWRWPERFG
jgi:hypothetical protein